VLAILPLPRHDDYEKDASMSFIDLHLHSTCSDGLLGPEQLVAAAYQAGLTTIALCDHDTVRGVAALQQAAATAGINVIPGVELSVAFQGYEDVHLLGYGIDINNNELLANLHTFALRRANRNREIITLVNAKLAQQGKTTLEVAEVEALAGGVIGRPHIGRALLARGHASDMQHAFDQYLTPCNVPKFYWPIAEALSAIKSAGGVAVLAHPTTISLDHHLLSELITELQALGLDCIEVYNSLAGEADALFLQGLTRRLDLLVTGGSDFHGIAPDERIGKGRGGIRFSDALLPPLIGLIAQRTALRRSV
jgi:hypothetical protein